MNATQTPTQTPAPTLAQTDADGTGHTAQAAAVRPPSAPRRRAGRLIRAVAVLAAVLGLAGSTTIAGASSASAASYAQVTVCFQSNYDFRVHGQPWTRQVKYILWNPSTARWQVQATYSSPTGCTKFSVYPGYRTFFEVYEYWGSYYYSSQTRVNTFAAGYTYNLGWFMVTKTLVF